MNSIMEATDKEIFSFDVLWAGWECDSHAWVMEKPNGVRYIVMTTHGTPYVATRKELEDRLDEYRRVIEDTEKAAVMALQGNY